MKKIVLSILITLLTISCGDRVDGKNTLITQTSIGDFFIGGIPKICNQNFNYVSFLDSIYEDEPEPFIVKKLKIFENGILLGNLTIDGNNRIASITIFSDQYKTKEGIHIGTSIEELFRKYSDIKIYRLFYESSPYVKIVTSDLPNIEFLIHENNLQKNTGIEDADAIVYKKNDFKPNTKIERVTLNVYADNEKTFNCSAGMLEIHDAEGNKPASVLLNGKSIYQSTEEYPHVNIIEELTVHLNSCDVYVLAAETGAMATLPDNKLMIFYGKDTYKIVSNDSFSGDIKNVTVKNNIIEYDLGYENKQIKKAVLNGDKLDIVFNKIDKVNLSENALGALLYRFESIAEGSDDGEINGKEVDKIFETPGFNEDAYNKLVTQTEKTKKAPDIKKLRQTFNNPGEEVCSQTFIVTGDNVRFRDAPSLNSKILTHKFMRNDKVKAIALVNLKDGNRFAKVEVNGVVGYISVDFLTEEY